MVIGKWKIENYNRWWNIPRWREVEGWIVTILVLVFLSPLNVYAGVNKKAGTTIGQVLEFGVGARACAMGEAFTGIADDFSAVYWNPAGIAQIQDLEFNFMHNDWFQGIKYEFVSTILPLEEEMGAIGLSGIILKTDDIVGRDTSGDFTSNFEAKDSILCLSFGQKLTEELMWGANIKQVNLKIENDKTNEFAFDFGGLYKFQDTELTLGAVVQNIGKNMKFIEKNEKLPLIFRLGASYKLIEKNVLLSLDIGKSVASNIKFNLGAEYYLTTLLKLRGGYNSTNDTDNGWTAGVGFKIKDIFELDYAYIPYGELGDTQRISITTKFKTE
ncbi:MAG: PorV/PorQ family protein [Nitrospirota bacterium]